MEPILPSDVAWAATFLADHGSSSVARRDELVDPFDHPMLLATVNGTPAGLLTYVVDGDACEILTLHAIERWRGIGSALIDAVAVAADRAGCRTLWVVTTNDNVDALRFYQRRGFRIRDDPTGAVDDARSRLKPGIPLIGDHGIPLRDEVELERGIAR